MLLRTISKITSAVFAGALSVVLSTAAFAHGSDWDVDADPGNYSDPIVLGDDIELDACGSTFYGGNSSYSLCQLSSLSQFTITWVASTDAYNWTYITSPATYSGSNTGNGLSVSVASGSGSYFSSAGTYYIGLVVTVNNGKWISTPGGSVYTYSDSGNVSGYYTSATFVAGSPEPSPVPPSVPEPASALLLLPGLAFIARRERRRRGRQQAA
ncbi:MAG: hypothetical protein EP335_16270 [Alphaproteobacteria bacterium]|nr:MAG: hypothetical protein EP335_16270 [Alphaproteobacteria bacterium]